MLIVDKNRNKVVDVNDKMQFDAEMCGMKYNPTMDTGAGKTVCDVKLMRKWQEADPSIKLIEQDKYK